MASEFITTRRIDFIDTDMAGIVHFANFYRYMETAEAEFFRSLGLKLIERQPDGSWLGWPRLAASCSFRAPAYFDDVLEIRLVVVRKSAKTLTYAFEFRRGETLVAQGELKTAYCRSRPGQPLESLEMPEEFAKAVQVNGSPQAGRTVPPEMPN
jgi:YbgC/YbaW family acyl-CoA thioester hydrolase